MAARRKLKYREPQYECLNAVLDGALGPMANHTWQADPKRLGFTLARYTVVAKLLEGRSEVLEVGCGDGWATRIVQQHVPHVTGIDFDPAMVESAERVNPSIHPTVWDYCENPLVRKRGRVFDGAYALDVIEHIQQPDEQYFIENICHDLTDDGMLILGSPSLESQAYASSASRAGHVNCKTGPQLRALLQRFFYSVIVFGMNDATLHLGFEPMQHYRFGVGTHLKR